MQICFMIEFLLRNNEIIEIYVAKIMMITMPQIVSDIVYAAVLAMVIDAGASSLN